MSLASFDFIFCKKIKIGLNLVMMISQSWVEGV
jgi:hypothetical protein